MSSIFGFQPNAGGGGNVSGDYVTIDTEQDVTGLKRMRNDNNELHGVLIQPSIEAEDAIIDPLEISYLEGASGNLQDQIDALPSLSDNNVWTGTQLFTGAVTFNDDLSAPHCAIVPANGDDLCNKSYVDSVMAASKFELFFNYSQLAPGSTLKLLSSSQLVTNQLVTTSVPIASSATIATFSNTFAALGISKTIPAGVWQMTVFANINDTTNSGHFAFSFSIYATITGGAALLIATSGITPFVFAFTPSIGSYTTSISLPETNCSTYDNLTVEIRVINTRTSGQAGDIRNFFQYENIYSYLLTSYSVLTPPSITETNNTWTGVNTFTQTIQGQTTSSQKLIVTSKDDGITYYPVFSNALGASTQDLCYDNVTTPFSYIPSTGTLSALGMNVNTIQSNSTQPLTLKINGGASNAITFNTDGSTLFYSGTTNVASLDATKFQLATGVNLNMNRSTILNCVQVGSASTVSTGLNLINDANNAGGMLIQNGNTASNMFFRQFGTLNGFVFQSSGGSVEHLRMSGFNANSMGVPLSITSTGQSRTLTLADTSNSRNFSFYPNVPTSGNLGGFCRPNDTQIAAVGTIDAASLTLMPYATQTVGVRLSATEALIGAGGTASFYPSSSINFSGTTAAMRGNLTLINASPTISSSDATTPLTIQSGSAQSVVIKTNGGSNSTLTVNPNGSLSIANTGTSAQIVVGTTNSNLSLSANGTGKIILGSDLDAGTIQLVSVPTITSSSVSSDLTLTSGSGRVVSASTFQSPILELSSATPTITSTTNNANLTIGTTGTTSRVIINKLTSPNIVATVLDAAGSSDTITFVSGGTGGINFNSLSSTFSGSIRTEALTFTGANPTLYNANSFSLIGLPPDGTITITAGGATNPIVFNNDETVTFPDSIVLSNATPNILSSGTGNINIRTPATTGGNVILSCQGQSNVTCTSTNTSFGLATNMNSNAITGVGNIQATLNGTMSIRTPVGSTGSIVIAPTTVTAITVSSAGITNFVSSPTMPTPTINDSSTNGATTAYVKNQNYQANESLLIGTGSVYNYKFASVDQTYTSLSSLTMPNQGTAVFNTVKLTVGLVVTSIGFWATQNNGSTIVAGSIVALYSYGASATLLASGTVAATITPTGAFQVTMTTPYTITTSGLYSIGFMRTGTNGLLFSGLNMTANIGNTSLTAVNNSTASGLAFTNTNTTAVTPFTGTNTLSLLRPLIFIV